MSESKVETEPTTDPELPEHNTEAQEPEQGDKRNREAARYRKAARVAEGQRDALAARLDAAHGAMLASQLKGNVTADALTAAGHTLDTLRDEDGNLDPVLITAAEADTAAKFGIQKQRLYVPNEGGAPDNNTMGNKWEGAFAPKE